MVNALQVNSIRQFNPTNLIQLLVEALDLGRITWIWIGEHFDATRITFKMPVAATNCDLREYNGLTCIQSDLLFQHIYEYDIR